MPMPKPPETADRSDTARESPVPEPLAFVMIAAPDPDLRLYVRRCLDGMADEVVEAADGLEALKRIVNRPVDLVIADAVMPRLDGLELSRVMAARGVPVLLLDGSSLGDLPPGVSVLEKPFERRELRAAVRKAAGL